MPERFFLPFMDALHQLFERTLRMDFNAERVHACKHAGHFPAFMVFSVVERQPEYQPVLPGGIGAIDRRQRRQIVRDAGAIKCFRRSQMCSAAISIMDEMAFVDKQFKGCSSMIFKQASHRGSVDFGGIE